MPYLILGFCLLVALALMARWFVTVDPRHMVTILKYSLAAILAVVAVFFGVTGRVALAAPAGIGALMLLGRWPLRRKRRFPGMGGGWGGHGVNPSAGQASEVETQWIRMTLDHDSGEMSGEVLKGGFRGRALDDLRFEQLIELLGECQREDQESAALLATYLDRHHADWRDRVDGQSGAAGGAGRGKMTVEEAYEVLGLAPGAGDDEIREAHRGLMKKLHPDQGGSTYLASKLNEAKDLLLGR